MSILFNWRRRDLALVRRRACRGSIVWQTKEAAAAAAVGSIGEQASCIGGVLALLFTLCIQSSFSGDTLGGASTHLSSVATPGDTLISEDCVRATLLRINVVKSTPLRSEVTDLNTSERQEFIGVTLQVNVVISYCSVIFLVISLTTCFP